MSNVLGTKGQIVIEKAIRDELNLQPGFIAVQKMVNGHIEMYFYPPGHRRSLRGILARPGQPILTTEQLASAREEAWTVATKERWAGSAVEP